MGKLSAGQERYYLEQAGARVDAVDSITGGAEDYYLDPSEARGEWRGKSAARLGLTGSVGPEDLRRLLAGQHPTTGAQLRRMTARSTVAAYDLTFSAPKSVSVLLALADQQMEQAVRESHETAVAEAFAYVERTAAAVRRGHDGATVLSAAGLAGAAFCHRCSRAGDPQLHTHVVIANLGLGPDGRWSALDGRRLYAQARAASAVYQTVLRGELTRRLGVGWTAVDRGIAEVDGVPKALMRAFSRRRVDIEDAMSSRGTSGPRAAQVAALDTRRRKRHGVADDDLRREWRDRAAELGWAIDELQDRLGHEAAQFDDEHWARIVEALAGPQGLTRERSSFGRRDVLRAICDRLPPGVRVTAAELESLTERFLAGPTVVPLVGEPSCDSVECGFRRRDGRPLPVASEEHRFTTVDLLDVEHRLLESVATARDARVGQAEPAAVSSSLAARPSLSREQAVMVRRLTEGGEGVAVVAGRAGTGKTFALDAAREVWEASGFTVMGAAVARRAAYELERGAGIPSTSVHHFLASTARLRRIPRRAVVVVDEAGMLGTRQMAQLVDCVRDAGGKLVLVGDPRQLAELEAGGAFRALARRPEAILLQENRRQRETWERTAVDHLRNGRAGRALALYEQHGRVHLDESPSDARARLVADWWAAGGDERSLIIVPTREDARDLNRLARERIQAAGLLGPDINVRGHAFAVGDRVVVRSNDRRLGVHNGDLARITELDRTRHRVEFRLERDGRVVSPPIGFLGRRTERGEPVLQHGYAVTGHIAQGMTVDRAFVLAGPGLSSEWAYAAMTRGRLENRLYAARREHGRDEYAPAAAIEHRRDGREELIWDLSTSDAQPLALELRRSRSIGRGL